MTIFDHIVDAGTIRAYDCTGMLAQTSEIIV
jgi:hypothetical protein